MGFKLYIGNIKEMATHTPKREDGWNFYVGFGINAHRNINGTLMRCEMLQMREEQREKYIEVHEIMCQLEEMNAFMCSPEIGIITQRELRGIETWICELHVRRCNIVIVNWMSWGGLCCYGCKDGTED